MRGAVPGDTCEHLLPGEAGKARGGIDAGHQEGRDGQAHEGEASLFGYANLRAEAGQATGEERHRARAGQLWREVRLLEGADRDKRQNGQDAFEQHPAVGDGPDVALVVNLLGGRAGSDKGVEAGAGAARDGDEEYREERLRHASRIGCVPAREGVQRDFGPSHEHAGEAQRHHCVEEIAVEVVAWLEKQPDRQRRGQEAVCQQDERPDHLRLVG